MWGLLILRCCFIIVASGVGVFIMNTTGFTTTGNIDPSGLAGFIGIFSLAVVIVIADWLIPRKRVDLISSVYFGLLIGLLMTCVVGFAIIPLFPPPTDYHDQVSRSNSMLVLGICLCYICTSFLIQTRDDFRFIIPYVEFQKHLRGNRPLVLDTSVVIDGRIADVMETNIIDSQLIIPRFVINELQHIADSSDRGRRVRGRRGLDVLNRLQKMKGVGLQIDNTNLPEFKGQPVDLKLVSLTRHIEGRLVTNDFNLNKVARLQGVDVINLNELANALKPVFMPGERIDIDIVKSGEEAAQGIGYLDDGTMVVVDNGRAHVAERVVVTVTSVLQTSAGRMVFGRYEFTSKKLASSTIVIDAPGTAPQPQKPITQNPNAVKPLPPRPTQRYGKR